MSEQSKYTNTDVLKIGSVILVDYGCPYGVVLDIYDDIIFHSVGPYREIMQYNISHVKDIVAEINIDNEMESIKINFNNL